MNRWQEKIIFYILAGISFLLISHSNAPVHKPVNGAAVFAPPFSTVPTSGLIASYPFNGNANDESGNGNDGSVFIAKLVQDRFCEPNRAYYFNGGPAAISTSTQYPAPGPNNLTFSIWFNTTSTKGGKLLGYGDTQTGASGHYDRNIYMTDNGQLIFGVFLGYYDDKNNFGTVKTTNSYNNGAWHHVVATLSANGIKLYINGVLQAHDPSVTVGEDFSGYWKIGYDELYDWPEEPTNPFFKGSLDDIHIYDREISLTEVGQLYKGDEIVKELSLCAGQTLNLTATTVSGASYSWEGPNEFKSNEQNPVIENVGAIQEGTYTVKATGSEGCSFQESTVLTVDPATVGGTLAGDAIVCSGANSGTISLSGQTGDVLRWESASVADFSTFTSILSTDLQLNYVNLSRNTYYRAVVKKGVCEEAFSSTAFIEVSELQAGSVSGTQTVCSGNNSGTLTLTAYKGAILRWESSVDDFRTVRQIANTTEALLFNNLTETTRFRALIGNGGICEEVYSQPATVQVDMSPVGGTISGAATVCAGNNSGTLSLENYQGTILRWESSTDGFTDDIQTIANTTAEYSFNNITSSYSYRVLLGSGVCQEVYSEAVLVEVDPQPKGGSLSGGGLNLCAGDNSGSLLLSEHEGNILRWESSSDGFTGDIKPIAHSQATFDFQDLSQTTSYRAIMGNEGCGEVFSTVATIQISQPSQGGTLEGSTKVCKGTNSGQLSLEGAVGQILHWESSTDNFETSPNTISSEESTISYQTLNETTYYRALVQNGSCSEIYSSVGKVEVSELQAGSVSGAQAVCSGDNSGTLTLTAYKGAILRWESSVDDFQTVQQIANTTEALSFNDLSETTRFRAVIGNGGLCQEVYSRPASVQVDMPPVGGTVSGAATVCAGSNSGTLSLENQQGTILRWESSTDGFTDDIQTIAYSEPAFEFQNLSQTTSYRAVLGNQVCGEVLSAEVSVVVEQVPVGGLVQGSGRLKAGDNSGVLSLQDFLGTIIRWEVSSDNFAADIRELSHTAATYTYQNIEQDSWFRAVLHNEACGEVYAGPAALLVNKAPLVAEDVLRIPYGQDFSSKSSLLENGSDPEGDPLVILAVQDQQTPAGNHFDIDADGFFYFRPAAGFIGTDSLYYELCDDVGEISLCSQGLILLEVGSDSDREVVVYQGFSPNNDGKNDLWVIDRIEHFPDNHVQVFNRFGNLVYEIRGYNNAERVFEGFSNKGIGSAGNFLPEATYYYRIRLDDERPLLNGYVILNR